MSALSVTATTAWAVRGARINDALSVATTNNIMSIRLATPPKKPLGVRVICRAETAHVEFGALPLAIPLNAVGDTLCAHDLDYYAARNDHGFDLPSV